MSVELPVLAYFDTPKTRKSNGLSSLFQNRVYFEIWNIEKNNSIFTIKFYDKIRGMTYLENFKLYAFGKLLTDIKVNFKKYINIIYKDENYELETIVNHNYWKNNETYSLLCKNIKSKNHENLCTLFKTSDKDYTPRLFHKLTGKLSKLKKNTFHDKTLLDAIKMKFKMIKSGEYISSDDDILKGEDSETDDDVPSKTQIKKKTKDRFEIINHEKRKPMRIKKKPTNIEWDDIYMTDEQIAPVNIEEFKNRIVINYAKGGVVQTTRLKVYTVSTSCINEYDNTILSIVGNKIDKKSGERSFCCTLYDRFLNTKYNTWIPETSGNMYYILICDVYCRFMGLPRPKSLSWMLSSHPNQIMETKPELFTESENNIKKEKDTEILQLSIETLEDFILNLPISEEYYKNYEIIGPHTAIDSEKFWNWMFKKLCLYLNIDNITLHPRISIMIRIMLIKKLKETKFCIF